MKKEVINPLRVLGQKAAAVSISLAYNIRVVGRENLREARQILEKDDLNLILYSNHASFSDPVLAILIYTKLDPFCRRRLAIPASYKFLDPKNESGYVRGAAYAAEVLLGAAIFPVIQDHYVDDYSIEMKTRMDIDFIKGIAFLKSKGRVAVVIFPEGHRGDDGGLGEIKGGIARLGTLLHPALFVPLGISYEEGYQRSGLNLGKRVELNVGEPFYSRGSGRGDRISLRQRLLNVLPEKMPRPRDAV